MKTRDETDDCKKNDAFSTKKNFVFSDMHDCLKKLP